MTELDLAWAAGFFDGEGCVTITKHMHRQPKFFVTGTRRRRMGLGLAYALRISVTNRNIELLQRFRVLFGGVIMQKKKHSSQCGTAYEWRLTGIHALLPLERLLPYLIGKRAVAEVGYCLQTVPRGNPSIDACAENSRA